MVNCVLRGANKSVGKKPIVDLEDDGSDNEEEAMVCPMAGQAWEFLPLPVIINNV